MNRFYTFKKHNISYRQISLWAITLILSLTISAIMVAQTSSAQDDVRLSPDEFRIAAEERISWRAPNQGDSEQGAHTVKAKILGFNDFHGNLNNRYIAKRPVGGAAVFVAYLKAEIAEIEGRAIIVHAGDAVGGSPPVSALMNDEPTLEILNMLANKNCSIDDIMNPLCNMVGTLGNHEFDGGMDELFRLLSGGKHPGAKPTEAEWSGIKFPYVSANVVDVNTNDFIVPPYVIKNIDGVRIAFIGAVLTNAATIVMPSNVAGLRFEDEATAINRQVADLKSQGVQAIIVTIHEGMGQFTFGADVILGEDGEHGKIIDIVSALDEEVDIVISGHAHAFTNTLVPVGHADSGQKILLTQAFSAGTAYSDIDIILDPVSGDIIEKSASIITTWADQGPGLTPDAPVADLVKAANIAVKPLVDRVVGVAATDIPRKPNDAGESALGNLISDAIRKKLGVEFVISSAATGGIRGTMLAGDITWGNLFTIQPFGNSLVTMTLTGQQIKDVLNQQWADRAYDVVMQISGFSYTWDVGRPEDDRIVEILKADGTALDMSAKYRVAMPNYYAGGGSGFDVFTHGTDQVIGPLLLDTLVAYIEEIPEPITAAIDGRISVIE